MSAIVKIVTRDGILSTEKNITAHIKLGWSLFGQPFPLQGNAAQVMMKSSDVVPEDPGHYMIVQKDGLATLEMQMTVLLSQGYIAYGSGFQVYGMPAQAVIFGNVPVMGADVTGTTDADLMTWAASQTFQLVSAVRDANSAIVTAKIVWPDGVSGDFTTDVFNTNFPGAIDAWHATYGTVPPRLITQLPVTRDSNGAVIAQPAIAIH